MHTQNWGSNRSWAQGDERRGPGDGGGGGGDAGSAGGDSGLPPGSHGPVSGDESQSYSRQRPNPGSAGHGSSNYGYGEKNSGYAERNPGRSDGSERGVSSLRSGGNMMDFGRGGPQGRMPQRPFQGRGPRNYTRSSERIREDVCEYLSEGFLDASDIEVQVSDGIVTLSGTVMDRRSKLVAEELAESVPGVQDVDNRLRIARDFEGPGAQAPRSEAPVVQAQPVGPMTADDAVSSPRESREPQGRALPRALA